MNEIKNIVFMKYGVHASENVDDIILRKQKECETSGRMFWGYGGTLCHPINQVQTFVKNNEKKGEKTYLVLSATSSKLYNDAEISNKYSIDKKEWISIPEGICVLGSKFAIVCKDLKQCDFEINLEDYIIPVGNSSGKILSRYIQGRVDKACGTLKKNSVSKANKRLKITLIGEIIYPYSVFLDNE